MVKVQDVIMEFGSLGMGLEGPPTDVFSQVQPDLSGYSFTRATSRGLHPVDSGLSDAKVKKLQKSGAGYIYKEDGWIFLPITHPYIKKPLRISGKYTSSFDLPALVIDLAREMDRLDVVFTEEEKRVFNDVEEMCTAFYDLNPKEQERVCYRACSLLDRIVQMDMIKVQKMEHTCSMCFEKMEFFEGGDIVQEDMSLGNASLFVCFRCNVTYTTTLPIKNYTQSSNGFGGTTVNSGILSSEQEEGGRTVVAPHVNYDDRQNFSVVWELFHGIIYRNLPDTLYDELDAYFVTVPDSTSDTGFMKPGAYYRSLPVEKNQYGELYKRGTSIEKLHKALEHIKRPFYDEEIWIRYDYWGWPLPNVEHLREIVFKNYHKVQSAIHLIDRGERTSNLSKWFQLQKHLYAAGCRDYGPHFFKTANTIEIKNSNEHIWEQSAHFL